MKIVCIQVCLKLIIKCVTKTLQMVEYENYPVFCCCCCQTPPLLKHTSKFIAQWCILCARSLDRWLNFFFSFLLHHVSPIGFNKLDAYIIPSSCKKMALILFCAFVLIHLILCATKHEL